MAIEKIRILVVDDHELVREGLKALFSTDEELEVVGEADNGEEAIEMVRRCRPNVVLMDMRLPGINGVEAVRLIKEEHPAVSVVMLTAYQDESYITSAVEAGVAGYLFKDASAELLCHAVHAVHEGGNLLGGNLLRETLTSLRSGGRPRRSDSPPVSSIDNLTPREREVLTLIVDGMANKEIASALFIAEDTVKKHVQGIISKLGVSDRTQAAVRAVREGF